MGGRYPSNDFEQGAGEAQGALDRFPSLFRILAGIPKTSGTTGCGRRSGEGWGGPARPRYSQSSAEDARPVSHRIAGRSGTARSNSRTRGTARQWAGWDYCRRRIGRCRYKCPRNRRCRRFRLRTRRCHRPAERPYRLPAAGRHGGSLARHGDAVLPVTVIDEPRIVEFSGADASELEGCAHQRIGEGGDGAAGSARARIGLHGGDGGSGRRGGGPTGRRPCSRERREPWWSGRCRGLS